MITDVACYALLAPDFDPGFTSSAQDSFLVVIRTDGGVFGVGLGAGSPLYIPAVHTDFVLAAIGEELGLIGTLAVVNLFVLLVVRGFMVALRARSGFNALLAAGLTAVVGLQALIIMAGALELIPLTGITLPFVSYGGSSVVANFLILGLLLRISHEEASERAR